MYKKIAFVLLALILIIIAFTARFYLSNTAFTEDSKYLYIHTGHIDKETIMKTLVENKFLKNPGSFAFLAGQMNIWPQARPGRYKIVKNMSLLDIARVIRNGRQEPLNLVITKVRTKEQLASLIGKKFETDSLSIINYLNNPDTLKKYGLDTTTIMTMVFPDTYAYLWTASPEDFFKKLYAQYNKIWTDERRQKAEALGLTPTSAYILASIVEEETNANEEKGMIASVYLNRLSRGMNLGADPTIKFALRDFGLTRIYHKHLAYESPYNTYRNKGLPPGPICTPSLKTLDHTLDAPKTNYLFFVANKDFSQKHVFTETYSDHLKYAREYQKELTRLQKLKKQTAKEEISAPHD